MYRLSVKTCLVVLMFLIFQPIASSQITLLLKDVMDSLKKDSLYLESRKATLLIDSKKLYKEGVGLFDVDTSQYFLSKSVDSLSTEKLIWLNKVNRVKNKLNSCHLRLRLLNKQLNSNYTDEISKRRFFKDSYSQYLDSISHLFELHELSDQYFLGHDVIIDSTQEYIRCAYPHMNQNNFHTEETGFNFGYFYLETGVKIKAQDAHLVVEFRSDSVTLYVPAIIGSNPKSIFFEYPDGLGQNTEYKVGLFRSNEFILPSWVQKNQKIEGLGSEISSYAFRVSKYDSFFEKIYKNKNNIKSGFVNEQLDTYDLRPRKRSSGSEWHELRLTISDKMPLVYTSVIRNYLTIPKLSYIDTINYNQLTPQDRNNTIGIDLYEIYASAPAHLNYLYLGDKTRFGTRDVKGLPNFPESKQNLLFRDTFLITSSVVDLKAFSTSIVYKAPKEQLDSFFNVIQQIITARKTDKINNRFMVQTLFNKRKGLQENISFSHLEKKEIDTWENELEEVANYIVTTSDYEAYLVFKYAPHLDERFTSIIKIKIE